MEPTSECSTSDSAKPIGSIASKSLGQTVKRKRSKTSKSTAVTDGSKVPSPTESNLRNNRPVELTAPRLGIGKRQLVEKSLNNSKYKFL